MGDDQKRRQEGSDGLAIIGRREVAATFGTGETRVEVVSVKINYVDLDTATFEQLASGPGQLAHLSSSSASALTIFLGEGPESLAKR
jgi:hypothetical protein